MSEHGLSGLRVFVQARMSSHRFPGKVLAPFRGQPIILHVIDAVERAVGRDALVVLTSTDRTDDPLAAYLASLNVHCFRGPLDNVFERFRLAALEYRCEWFLRICADSPLLDPALIARVTGAASPDADLVTTVFPRTFPHGQGLELVRTTVFLAVDRAVLTADDREHVTPYFYRHARDYRITSIRSESPAEPGEGQVVDTLEDLRRLEPARS